MYLTEKTMADCNLLYLMCFLLWADNFGIFASGEISDFCPQGCQCGSVKDLWTYESQFTISCSNLSLTQVPNFEGWQKIDVLDLTSHSISVLKNHAFKGIMPKKILLQNNKISVIEPEAFTDVAEVTKKLDLSSNIIVDLPQGLNKMSALKTLTLAGNRKLNLQKGSFHGLRSLEDLDLSSCSLKTVPEGTFEDIGETLKSLKLSYNELTSIPSALQQLRQLEEIDFDSNSITSVSAHTFRGTKLRKLSLSRNEFAQPDSIHPLAFVDIALSLEDLDFYHSDLIECPTESLKPLKNLKQLSFNANNIRHFPPKAFQSLDSLEELTLDGNEFSFTREMFTGITDTVHMLSIRRMGLTELPVHEIAVLDHLQWLDASSNSFVSLPENFTSGLSANRYTLMWMNIENISPEAFAGKKRPIHLSLDSNKVSSLDFVVDPCMYEYVEVRENPLVCDCHSLYVAMHSDLVLAGTCTQPPAYANMDVSGSAFKTSAEKNCKNMNKTVSRFCPGRHEHHSWSSMSSSCRSSITTLLIMLLANFYTFLGRFSE